MNIDSLSDMQAEAGVIATLIKNPDFILYSDKLAPNHFYDPINACLYWSISELQKNKITNIDSFNLKNIINSNKSIKSQVENAINIDDLINLSTSISRDTIDEYKILFNTVLNFAYKRKLIKNLNDSINYCYDESLSINNLQTNLFKTIDDTNMEFVTNDNIKPYGDVVKELWNQTLARQNNNGKLGMFSKFPEVKKYYTFENGELVIVCAPRKEGKSILTLNEVYNQLKQDKSIIYYDSELSSRLFNERLICHMCKVKMSDVKSGSYTYEQSQLISRGIEWLEKKKNFTHINMPSWDFNEIYTTSKKAKRDNMLDLIVIDYFKDTENNDASSVYLNLGKKIDNVKNLICSELDIAGLGCAQLNRGGETADSYRIEQYCSVLCKLKRKTSDEIMRDGVDCGNYKLFINLNRLGEQMNDINTDYIDLNFYGNYCTFEEAKQQHIIDDSPFD